MSSSTCEHMVTKANHSTWQCFASLTSLFVDTVDLDLKMTPSIPDLLIYHKTPTNCAKYVAYTQYYVIFASALKLAQEMECTSAVSLAQLLLAHHEHISHEW